MPAEIVLVPCLSDNYAVILKDAASDTVVLVDAPDDGPIVEALDVRGWALTDILVTHKHDDHVAGLPALKERYGARIFGPKAEAASIPGIDVALVAGDVATIGPWRFETIATPGHTRGHVVFFEPTEKWLFSGDTLFAMGCGRLFEDTPAAMWDSLSKLARLPNDTTVWCGHEYTASNATFCAGVLPHDAAIAERLRKVEASRAAGLPTVPTTIGAEKVTNVFLRSGEDEVAAAVGLSSEDPAAVFAELRSRKNRG